MTKKSGLPLGLPMTKKNALWPREQFYNGEAQGKTPVSGKVMAGDA